MEIKGKVHCFFEQSGTFKNEFIKLGIPAEDYDIQNNFGETDHQIDLFAEIEKAYDGKASIFDNITPDDLIMAFFPCIYFCENNMMYFTGVHHNLKNLPQEEIESIIIHRAERRHYFYIRLLWLMNVCTRKGLRIIVENPDKGANHYLYNNFPYEPRVIDKDRTMRGDYFVKPTKYYFHNCNPTYGHSFQKLHKPLRVQYAKKSEEAGICSEERSMISPDYARNFICDFIIGKVQARISEPLLFDIN